MRQIFGLFLVCFCFLAAPVGARENFEFGLGKKLSILSDKAYRKTQENLFEAQGNVIINSDNNTLYGDRATISFDSGECEIVGSVRYVGPEYTIYGSKLTYNFNSGRVFVENAKINSESIVVIGKTIEVRGQKDVYASEAEYTTCRDCPESWSVYGRQVHVTVGEYVRVKNGYIKVNGAVVMFVPYIVFPIKKRRETGLLYPKLSINLEEGFRYQQPFYWAISDLNDLTLTPSFFGKRGKGGEVEFRQVLGPKTWFESNSIHLFDEIYSPYKSPADKSSNGDNKYRHFGEWEHHSSVGENFNHHFYYNFAKDLDVVHDLDFFVENKLYGSELGGGGFFEYRFPLMQFGVEGFQTRNLLIDEYNGNDKKYVQLLPKIYGELVPINLLRTDYFLLKNISVGAHSDLSIFRQQEHASFIRDANRLNVAPYLDWQLGQIGPVQLSTLAKLDYQKYSLTKSSDKSFSKRGIVYESEARIELEKVFGIAFQDEIPFDQVELNKKDSVDLSKKESDQLGIVGTFPSYKDQLRSEKYSIEKIAMRHSQEFKLKHYFISDQTISGNSQFRSQIESDAGQFDYLDAIRSKEYEAAQVTAKDSLPLANTVELQWNNSLILKRPTKFDPFLNGIFLRDNFDYSKIAFFNLSQGVDLNKKKDAYGKDYSFNEKLTRLYLKTGLNYNQTSLTLEEYYYHQQSEHKMSLDASQGFSRGTFGGNFSYNSFNSTNTPPVKTVGVRGEYQVFDSLLLKGLYDYNIEDKLSTKSMYGFGYVSSSNCWKLLMNYTTERFEKRLSFDLKLNYNSAAF